MSWVLVLIAVWVVVALAVALVIGRSIHLADLKRQAALDRHLTFGGSDLAREGSGLPRCADSADDGPDVVWRDVAAGEAPRTAPRRGRSAVGGHAAAANRPTRGGERRRA